MSDTPTEADPLVELGNLISRFERAAAALPPVTAARASGGSASVTISAGGALAVAAILISIIVGVVASALAYGVSVRREADLRQIDDLRAALADARSQHDADLATVRQELGGLREKTDIAAAYNEKQNQRLTTLEARGK